MRTGSLSGEHRIFLTETGGPGSLAEALNRLVQEGRVTARFEEPRQPTCQPGTTLTVVVSPDTPPARVVEMIDVGALFPIFASLDEAIHAPRLQAAHTAR